MKKDIKKPENILDKIGFRCCNFECLKPLDRVTKPYLLFISLGEVKDNRFQYCSKKCCEDVIERYKENMGKHQNPFTETVIKSIENTEENVYKLVLEIRHKVNIS